MGAQKLIAALTMIAGLSLAGRAAAAAEERRVKILTGLSAAVEPLGIRMLLRKLPLDEALKKSESPIMKMVGEALNETTSARDGWARVRERERKSRGTLDSLTQRDFETLDSFFCSLGASGAREQEARLNLAQKEFEEARIAATAELGVKRRLYSSLGALAGATAAIMIL